MANDPRQEVELPFGGRTFRVRPTFGTITAIEQATNQSAMSLGRKALQSATPSYERFDATPEISLSELAVVVFNALRGQPDAPKTVDEVGSGLVDDGFATLLAPVGVLLTRAQSGNKQYVQRLEEDEAARRKAADAQPKEGQAADAKANPPTAG